MATTKKKRSTMPVSKATNAFELLGEIIEIILEEPLRYDQGVWLMTCVRDKSAPKCGTVGCVAGWIVALKGKRSIDSIRRQATEILGLDLVASQRLFSSFDVIGCGQTTAHAKSGAAHIKKFMKAHEAQLKAKKV